MSVSESPRHYGRFDFGQELGLSLAIVAVEFIRGFVNLRADLAVSRKMKHALIDPERRVDDRRLAGKMFLLLA